MAILFILKTILYLNLTQIEFNRLPIFLITSMITIFILSLIYKSKSKYRKTMAIVFHSLISFIMFVDAIYYSQFGSLPSVILLGQSKQLVAVTDSIRFLLDIRNLLLILDLPILIIVLRYMDRKNIRINLINKLENIRPSIILGVLVLTFGYIMATDQLPSVKAQELYSFHAIDIVRNIWGESDQSRASISEEDIKDLESRRDFQEGNLTGLGEGKNLIVIQIESLQDFVIGLEYEGQEVTPNLNKLIKNQSTIYYDNYYQLIGRGNTSDAEFVSHNSLYPSMEEPSYVQYEENTFYGLPWLLGDQDYTAWAFHGYEKDFWNREKAYVNQGFERFISEEDFEFEEEIGFGLRDEDFFKQSLEYLKELDRIDDNPFYAFLVTLSSHVPYKMDKKYHELDIKKEHENTILGDYLQSIHYLDKHLGIFLEDLKKEGLYDNSVIAMYGDHFGIANTKEDTYELMSDYFGEAYDFDLMTNIPLMITVPGEDIRETKSIVGSQLDFYPTIANIMGYKNEKGLIFGRDLNNYEGNNFVAPQTYMLKGSFIDEDTLFVISRDGVFDHSRAKDMKTRQEIEDLSSFKEKSQKAVEEINKSEFILRNNLLKDYIENQGQINLEDYQEIDPEDLEIQVAD